MIRNLLKVVVLIILTSKLNGQIDLEICHKRMIKIKYSNHTDSALSYFSPFVFLSYEPKSKKKLFIRGDRYYATRDTLFVFFNDTSFNEVGFDYNPTDSLIKKDNGWTSRILPPNGEINIKVYLKRKQNFKVVVVYTTIEERCVVTVKRRWKLFWWRGADSQHDPPPGPRLR